MVVVPTLVPTFSILGLILQHCPDGPVALPAGFLGDDLRAPLADRQHGQHGVDGRHGGEDTGVGDPQPPEAPDVQSLVHDRHGVPLDVTHLGRPRRVVDGVGDPPGVLAQVLVGLHLEARRHLTLDPVLERGLLGDLAGGLQPEDERGGVVTLRVGEVPEIEGRFDGRVGRGEVEFPTRPGSGDVGGHAKGVDRSVVAQPGRVETKWDLITVHHDVRDVGIWQGVWVCRDGFGAGGVGSLAT